MLRPKAGAREGQQGINQAGMEVAVGQVSFNRGGIEEDFDQFMINSIHSFLLGLFSLSPFSISLLSLGIFLIHWWSIDIRTIKSMRFARK